MFAESPTDSFSHYEDASPSHNAARLDSSGDPSDIPFCQETSYRPFSKFFPQLAAVSSPPFNGFESVSALRDISIGKGIEVFDEYNQQGLEKTHIPLCAAATDHSQQYFDSQADVALLNDNDFTSCFTSPNRRRVRPQKKLPKDRVREFLTPSASRRKSRAGRKPLSGVFGICRQDSRWVVSYRDRCDNTRHRYFLFHNIEEQSLQLNLAKRFLWKVVRAGRKVNPRDGEGLEEFVRSYESDGSSEFLGLERANAWAKEESLSSSRLGKPSLLTVKQAPEDMHSIKQTVEYSRPPSSEFDLQSTKNDNKSNQSRKSINEDCIVSKSKDRTSVRRVSKCVQNVASHLRLIDTATVFDSDNINSQSHNGSDNSGILRVADESNESLLDYQTSNLKCSYESSFREQWKETTNDDAERLHLMTTESQSDDHSSSDSSPPSINIPDNDLLPARDVVPSTTTNQNWNYLPQAAAHHVCSSYQQQHNLVSVGGGGFSPPYYFTSPTPLPLLHHQAYMNDWEQHNNNLDAEQTSIEYVNEASAVVPSSDNFHAMRLSQGGELLVMPPQNWAAVGSSLYDPISGQWMTTNLSDNNMSQSYFWHNNNHPTYQEVHSAISGIGVEYSRNDPANYYISRASYRFKIHHLKGQKLPSFQFQNSKPLRSRRRPSAGSYTSFSNSRRDLSRSIPADEAHHLQSCSGDQVEEGGGSNSSQPEKEGHSSRSDLSSNNSEGNRSAEAEQSSSRENVRFQNATKVLHPSSAYISESAFSGCRLEAPSTEAFHHHHEPILQVKNGNNVDTSPQSFVAQFGPSIIPQCSHTSIAQELSSLNLSSRNCLLTEDALDKYNSLESQEDLQLGSVQYHQSISEKSLNEGGKDNSEWLEKCRNEKKRPSLDHNQLLPSKKKC